MDFDSQNSRKFIRCPSWWPGFAALVTRVATRPWCIALAMWLIIWPSMAVVLLGPRYLLGAGQAAKEEAKKTITCECLNIVGPDGKTKAILESTSAGAELTLRDAGDVIRIRLGLNKLGSNSLSFLDRNYLERLILSVNSLGRPVVQMRDANNNRRLSIHDFEDGSPTIALCDEKGVDKIDLSVSSKGLPYIDLTGLPGKTRLRIAIHDKNSEGPTISFHDQEGKSRMEAMLTKTGPSVALLDRNVVRAQLALDPDGTPMFSFNDKTSAPIFLLGVDNKGIPFSVKNPK